MFDAFNTEKLKHISLKDKTGLSIYPWRNCKPSRKVEITKPLSDCNIAIVSSAGLYIKDTQPKFDEKIKGGDYSFREIPMEVSLNNLKDSHRSTTFDHSGLISNPETGMPIPQLFELKKEGIIKKVNHRHISLMGSILAPGRLIKNTIPKIIEILKEDKVDIALMIPV
jgi:D-proline reductase (dithiol) PrdB